MIKRYWFKAKKHFFLLTGLKFTSETWQKIFPEITVLDPDGWDRRPKYYGFEWYVELIDVREYMSRVFQSTIMSDVRIWE